MDDHLKSIDLRPKWKRLWLHGFLLGAGLGLIVLLISHFIWVSPPPVQKTVQSQPMQAEPVQSTVPALEMVPEASAKSNDELTSQMEQVLTGIKEANQKKDLSQLLSYYSPSFPQLPQRAQTISKDWKVYEYPKMEFEIKELKLVADNTAVVKVTWNVEVQNISTKKIKNISKTYLTRFVKESGQWRIKALDKTE